MATCKVCGQKFSIFEIGRSGICDGCLATQEDRDREKLAKTAEAAVAEAEAEGRIARVVVTTAPALPGTNDYKIIAVIGAEAAVGMNVFRDIANSWIDTFGGRSGSVQKMLKEAREIAMRELKREAFLVGADAVVSVDIDYNQVSTSGGSGGSILFVAATGTAVKLAP